MANDIVPSNGNNLTVTIDGINKLTPVLQKAGKDVEVFSNKARKSSERIIDAQYRVVDSFKHVKAGKASFAHLGKGMREVDDVLMDIDSGIIKTNKAIKAAKVPFAGWAMSIMFFGMAVQRAFSQVAKFGTTTFNEIAHSVEGVVTNSDMLEGSMKYLGFTIGQALEPVIAQIIPIVEWIANWVEENPKLTATITTLGIVLGGLMAAGGGLILAINGFKELKNIISAAGGAGKALGKMGGAIAITYAVEEAVDAWAAFKDGKFGSALINAVSAGLIGAGGIKMATGKGGGALIAIGVSLDLIESGKFLQTLAAVLAAGYAIHKAFTDSMASLFEMGLKNMVDRVISALRLTGHKIPTGLTLLSNQLGKGSMNYMDNFTKNYEDAISKLMPLATEGDKKITEFIAYLDKPTQETQATAGQQASGGTIVQMNGAIFNFTPDEERMFAPFIKALAQRGGQGFSYIN